MLSTQLLQHYRQIAQKPLTVIDVETTGKHAYDSRVTEISVLRASLVDGIQAQQTDLVNPERSIPRKIIEITGITQEMVDAAPVAAEVFPKYLPLLNSGVLTAHHLDFDYSFLKTEFARLGIPFSRPEDEQLCTVQLSRLMLADLPSRSLPNLVKHFQFQVDRSHRAEADTLACWLLAERLLTEIQNESDDVLLEKFAQQWIPLNEAAAMLGCSTTKEGRSRLKSANVPSRFGGYSKNATMMYRRGDVERLVYEQQELSAGLRDLGV